MAALSRKNLWDHTPRGVKTVLRAALACLPPERLLGTAFRRNLAFANASQWWPDDQIRAYQLAQLQRIIGIAAERSPWYQRTFAGIAFDPTDLRNVDDLAALPLIDKNTIRDHLAEICTVSPDSPGVDHVSTGGSSGVPLGFYIGADRSATEFAYLTASWQRAGYDLKLPQALVRGQIVRPRRRDGLRHEFDPILRRHAYSGFHLTDENMRGYLAHLATIGPCFLQVYPSTIMALTRFIRRTGVPAPRNVRGILAGSEILYPSDRAAIEQTWGVRCFSWYGHTEKLALASECEHSADYHVWPTYGYVELLDPNGRPVTTPGDRGEIVATGFMNTVTPFIRYRTGDFATLVGGSCTHCGRRHMVLRDIRGHRTQELLVAADGSLVPWTAINMHDDTFARVRQFQFRQTEPGHATLRIVPGTGFSGVDAARIRRNLARKLAGKIEFAIETCDEIALTHRGKSTFVDQRLDLDAILQPEMSEA